MSGHDLPLAEKIVALAHRQRAWTMSEFLDWETRQEQRFEFDGTEPVGMVGGTAAHHRIVRNGETALRARLLGCEVFRETMKLRMAHTVRYPDLMVVCTKVEPSAAEVSDPVVVIEVLSESTAGDDRITKNDEYRATASIMHCVMIEQDRVAATWFTRRGDDWVGHVLVGGDAVLEFPEVSMKLSLAEFYAGTELVG